jgi:hypothetical protein
MRPEGGMPLRVRLSDGLGRTIFEEVAIIALWEKIESLGFEKAHHARPVLVRGQRVLQQFAANFSYHLILMRNLQPPAF